MIKVISFDIGGTLLKGTNNEKYNYQSLATLTKKDYQIIKNAYKNIFQKQKGSFDELVNQFCDTIGYQKNNQIIDFFHHKFNSNEGIISKETMEIIRKLKAMNYKVILLSNSCCLFKNALPEELLSLVDNIFYSYDYGYTKENDEIYKIVEAKIGNKSNEILHVGDTLISDYLKPITNGWQALYYGNKIDNNINSINNLNEIFKYL